MGKISRCLSSDGSVFVMAIDSTDMVNEAVRIHETSAVVSAAMGRLMTAASMMGYLLKNKDDSVTVRMEGDGPLNSVVAVADFDGNARVSPSHKIIEIPLNEKGKLDVGGAIGKNGILYVIRDMGLKEPYIGSTQIINGEIAEEVAAYYAQSEQIPTVCALGVLVDTDLTIRAAGGYLVQLLPFAGDDIIEKVEKSIEDIPPISEMIDRKMTPEEICKRVLSEFEVDLLDERFPTYRCNCSKERVEKALISLGREELTKIAEEDGCAEINCHFCDKSYKLTKEELLALIK